MIRVRVPGTTANLGPGFDCLGMAFDIYGEFSFEERENGELTFEDVAPEYCNADNLAVVAYRRALRELGEPETGLYLRIRSDVPVSSGLGSSASLLAAGLTAANAAHGERLDEAALLRLATELEGHPDNVAPALLGGLTASMVQDGRVISMRFPVDVRVRFCALIPNFSLSTKRAREALPKTVDFRDAVFNVSRVSVLLRALGEGNFDAIAAAMDDRLHQPYRAKLIDEYDAVRALALENGAAAFCISGAGPTLLSVYREDGFPERMAGAVRGLRNRWRVLPLKVDASGATVVGREKA